MKIHYASRYLFLFFALLCFKSSYSQQGTLVWFKQHSFFSPLGAATWSTPVAMNDKIYWQGQDGGLFCLNALTGALVWKDTLHFGAQIHHPAAANGNIYTVSSSSGFVSVDGNTGNILWKRSDLNKNLVYATPVKDSRVFIGTSDSVVCLSTSNGSTLWNTSLKTGYMLLKPGGKELICIDDSKAIIYGLNTLNGSLNWQMQLPDSGAALGAAALKDSNTLVVASALNFNVALEKFYCINLNTKSVVWSKNNMGYSGDYAPPVILDSMVYFSTRSNTGAEIQKIRALSLNTGNEKWFHACRSGFSGRSPVMAALDGKLFFNRTDTLVQGFVCVDANTGNELWVAKADSAAFLLCWGGMVIFNNKLYASPDMGGLYCFDAGTVNGNWSMFGANSYITNSYNAGLTGTGIKTLSAPSENLTVKQYPNPFSDEIYFEYNLREPATVHIEIFNFLGERIDEISLQKQSAGNNKMEWKANAAMTAGYYLYVVNIQEQKELKSLKGKMILLK